MGAGRTELAMSVFGRSYGRNATGRVFKDGREIHTRTVPEAIGHGIVYATEDRKHYGLNLMDDIARSVTLASLKKVSKRSVISEHDETVVAEGTARTCGSRRLRCGPPRAICRAATSRRSC